VGLHPETFARGRDRYTVEGFAGKEEVSAESHRDRRNRDDRNPNSLRRKVERKKGTCLQAPVSGWGKGSWFSCNRGSCFKQGRSSVPHSHALRKGRRRVTYLFITHIVDVRRVVARWFYVLLRRRCFHHHASSATTGSLTKRIVVVVPFTSQKAGAQRGEAKVSRNSQPNMPQPIKLSVVVTRRSVWNGR
jgi:hypothetical protein